ncbi:MAG: 2-isopropylmalate synthase [Chloroflexi bacterium]|nr:2-isopropylmalate synthase [Chloroflexota bacterium]
MTSTDTVFPSWLKLNPPETGAAEGPAYLRDTFPYTLPPIAWFEPEAVPLDPAPAIWITDTTFRDGQQSREPYSPAQIAHLYDLLHCLGGPNGMIRQSEFFLYTRKDREAVERCRELGHRYPEITGWIRATLPDYQLVRDAGLRETGILTSISDYHIFKKLNSDRETVLNGYLEVVDAALADGVIPRCHIEDSTRADFYHVVLPFVHALMERGRQAGIQVKVRFPDTLGVGVPHPNAALPRGIPRLTYLLRHEGGVPAEALEFHGQNDLTAIIPNAVSAWLYGASANNGTLLGIGERSGNTPIEALVFWLISLTGETHGMDTTVLTEIADYYRSIGEPVDQRLPLVGSNAFVTRAGIHADGMIKDEEIYNPFDSTGLLNMPPGVAITDKSGAAGLLMWMQTHRPDLAAGVSKRDPRLMSLLDAVMREYDDGRVTGLADSEVDALVNSAFGVVPAGAR